MNHAALLPLYYLAALYLCWNCYVLAMQAKRMRKAGTLTTKLAIAFAPAVTIGILIDVALQIAVTPFLGIPRELTLSSRFSRYREDPTAWRYQRAVANFFCESLLNPFDDRGAHC